MSRFWLAAIGAGIASALLHNLTEFGSVGGVLLSHFAPLPLYLVGLSLGLTAGTAASATAVAGIAMLAGLSGAGVFMVTKALPAIVVIRQALLSRMDNNGNQVWYPSGLLVVSLTATAVVLYTAAALWYGLQPAGFKGTVETLVTHVVQDAIPPEITTQRQGIVAALTEVMPALLVLSSLFMVAIYASLAQGVLTRLGRNFRPTPDIATMVLPRWVPAVSAIGVLAGMILPGAFGYYSANLAIILLVPYFFLGLAVVHALCRLKPAGAFMLFMFYILLVIFSWPIAIVVSVLGLIEQWAEFRRRFA